MTYTADARSTGDDTPHQALPSVRVDVSPAYDLLFSLSALVHTPGHTKEQEWVRTTRDGLTVARQRTMQRYTLATAYEALIPTLPEPHTVDAFLAGLAAMPVADFLRVAVTVDFAAPDTPLDAADLLALCGDRPRARAFVERYLRLSPRVRANVLHLLADPFTARRELVETLTWFAEGPFAALEPRLQTEREQAGERLREIVAARPDAWPEELARRGLLARTESLAGFSPVVLAPAPFLGSGRSTYYSEIAHTLFDGLDYEPFILAIAPEAVLGPEPLAQRGRRFRAASGGPTALAPEDRYATLFGALADPSRLRLVRLLAERPQYGQELAAALGMSAPTISHHIGALMRAGLVAIERQSHRTYYVLDTALLLDLLTEGGRFATGTDASGDAPLEGRAQAKGGGE